MANPVVWFEVMGKDGDALRAFYSEIFGWKYDVDDAYKYGMVGCPDGKGIPGGIGEDGNKRVTFYVSTPSIEDSLAAVEEKGGKTVMPRTKLPGGTTLALFADPDGNTIGLVEEAEA